jgi:hypothetical protein
MAHCFVCNSEISCTLNGYLAHLKSEHARSSHYGTYNCSQGQCCRTFTNKYTFVKHLRKCHSDDFTSSQTAVRQSSQGVSSNCLMESDGDCDENDISEQLSVDINVNAKQKIAVQELGARFIAEAKSCLSTLSTIRQMMGACKQLIDCIVNQVVEVLDSCNVDCPQVHSLLSECRNPFANLETDYAQNAYMESLGTFIEPETYVVGNRQTFVTDKVAKFNKPVMQAVAGQYVSISKTIMALNDKTDIIKQALALSCLYGSLWKQHPLKNEPVLVLRLYGDDFEPGNPLGRESQYTK